MSRKSNLPEPIALYFNQFPSTTQKLLNEIRNVILDVAPNSEELISYKMPAFKLHGMLVYYAAYSNHIGFYPTGEGIEAFKSELGSLKFSKGAVQFAIDKPLPIDLIRKMVKFKVNRNLEKLKVNNTSLKK